MNRARRVRELLLVIIGVITPVGVLAVNVSAFIMQHLGEFRLTIAACALISALVLNGFSAYLALRFAERNATPLFTEYRWWIVSLAVIAVLISAAVTTVLTYLGMRDPRHLPDLLSVLGSIAALAMPFALTYLQRRIVRTRPRSRQDGDRELQADGDPTTARSRFRRAPAPEPAPPSPRRPRPFDIDSEPPYTSRPKSEDRPGEERHRPS